MNRKTWFALLLPMSLGLLLGCGGSSSSSSGSKSSGSTSSGSGAVGAQNLVAVSAGQTTTGVNITVPAPASNPTPNAEFLGVTASLTGASASDNGTTIPRGSSMIVLLFGPGLSANMKVSITGPNDITISGLQSIQATDGTPGVAFNATVASTAAVGARTVILQDANNDITTFTGGLEVQ